MAILQPYMMMYEKLKGEEQRQQKEARSRHVPKSSVVSDSASVAGQGSGSGATNMTMIIPNDEDSERTPSELMRNDANATDRRPGPATIARISDTQVQRASSTTGPPPNVQIEIDPQKETHEKDGVGIKKTSSMDTHTIVFWALSGSL